MHLKFPYEDSAGARTRRERAVEVRFLVPSGLAAEIRSWARHELVPDPYGTGPDRDTYRITTLYLDTPRFDVHRRRGSFGRAKYRVRRYGAADVVYVERKLRTAAMLAKRRSAIPLPSLAPVLQAISATAPAAAWFARRVHARRLAPACVIAYDRMARQLGASGGAGARLTIDENIRASAAAGEAFRAAPDLRLLDGRAIVEMKFQEVPPPAFKLLVERFGLSPDRFSKYRHAIARLGLADEMPC